DFFIREATLIENVNHDMVVACTYSKKAKGRSAGTDGIFLAMVNPQGEVVKYKNGYYEFPLAELEKFESARNKRRMERKDDYEAPNLKVKNIITESDGSILLTCEEDYIIIHRNMNSGMGGMGMSGMTTTTYYTYHYEDIVAVKINAMGEYEWLRKIPKKQSGVRGEGSMSFKLINDSTGYYFLYLDNIKNMELTENEVPKEYRDGTKGQVVVSKIDNKGTLTKELILDTKEEEIKIFPTAFRRINGNQFIGRATLQKNLYKPLLITVN
ncbi:MAG: hypothetical protein HY305_05870, partial [Sphingobacteriales bacterium]|nr:hypothetical protein [Sphingobacteriales bacterium]